jgi:hypothetical protein
VLMSLSRPCSNLDRVTRNKYVTFISCIFVRVPGMTQRTNMSPSILYGIGPDL